MSPQTIKTAVGFGIYEHHRIIFSFHFNRKLVNEEYWSKWRVSPSEYAGRWFPPYCAGWVIVYSHDVAQSLYMQIQKEPYFWIDDVHITGTIVKKLNLTHTDLGDLGLSERKTEEMLEGEPQSDFLFSLTVSKHFRRLWSITNSENSNEI